MKLSFNLEMTPEEMSTLAKAEVESQRIREGANNDTLDEKKCDEIIRRTIGNLKELGII